MATKNNHLLKLREMKELMDLINPPTAYIEKMPEFRKKIPEDSAPKSSRSRLWRTKKIIDYTNPDENLFVRNPPPKPEPPKSSKPPRPGGKKSKKIEPPPVDPQPAERRVSIIQSLPNIMWNFNKGEPEPQVDVPKWMEPFDTTGLFEARFDILPMELILIIFKQITTSDRLAAGETCRRWNEASHYYEPFLDQTYYHFDRAEFGDQIAPFKYFSKGFRYYPRLVFTQVEFNKHSDFWEVHGLWITELTLRSCIIRKKKFISIMRNLLNLRRLELMQCDELFKNWTIEYNTQEPMFPFYMFCLKHLSLSGCDYFNEFHFERFITMAPNLQSIDVSNCFINLYLSKRITMLDRVMKLISRNRFLMKNLNLADTPCVDDLTWHCICDIEDLRLTHFTVAYCDRVPLKDPGIIRFFTLQTELTHLDLTSSIGLNDECMQIIITSCPLLHTLKIRRCWLLSDEGVVDMHTLQHLRVLDISGCERISDYGIMTGIVGKRHREMHEVYFSLLNNLSDSTMYYIIVSFKNLQILDLDSTTNSVTDETIQYIACYLHSLRHLNVVACTKKHTQHTSFSRRHLDFLKSFSLRPPKSTIVPSVPTRQLGRPELYVIAQSEKLLRGMKLIEPEPNEPDFGNLPTELLVSIFKYLSPGDRNAASYTCSKWYEASKYLGFARQMVLHLVGVEFDDCKPPVVDLLQCPHVFPVLKLTRVRLQQSVYSQFWKDFGPAISEITFEKCMIWRERIIKVLKHMNNLSTARFVECDLLRDDLFKEWKFLENGLLEIRFQSIKTLSLAKNNFTELQFGAIVEMMPNLTVLDLSNCFSYVDSASKTVMLNCILRFVHDRQCMLKGLIMSGISVDDLFLRGLGKAQDLRLESFSMMYLEKMPLRDPAIINFLRQQLEMRILDLSQSTGITDFCLDQIVRHMTKLKILDLTGCWNVGDYGVSQIFRLQNLEKLDLSQCRITKKGIIVGSAYCNRKVLKELHLELIDTLDDDCVVKIGANFTYLTVLNIGGSSSCMTDWSAQYIFYNLTCLEVANFERSTKLLVKIFKYLPVPDRSAASVTCWHWYEASKYLGFARKMCLHLVGVEFDDFKPPVVDLLQSCFYFPVLKLTRVKLNVYSKFWAKFGPFIQEITFEKCMIWRERIISVFKFMPNLRIARFVECDLLRDDLFKSWKFFENGVVKIYFPNIEHLSLAKNTFSELQFNVMLDMMPNLTEVDFSNCFRSVDPTRKAQLLNCILTFIQHRQNDLKSLNLGGVPVDDIFLRGMVRARGLLLKQLTLTYLEKIPRKLPAIIDLLQQQTEIIVLDLSQSTGINDYCIGQIVQNMPDLTIVRLTGCCGVSDYGVSQLFKLRKLEIVDLSKCRITKRGIVDGATNSSKTSLRELHMELLSPLDDECIVKVGSSFSNLTVLNMGGSASCMTDCALQHIFYNLTNLEHLNLERSTKLTDAGFTGIDLPQKTFAIWDIEETFSIDRLKKLRVLKVSGCYKLTDFSLRYAFRFMELKELSLSRCHQISKQGIEKLVTSCPALEYLDLSECPNINDYCVELIAQNLKRLSTLKLANCPLISEVGLSYISQYCKNLKYLYVRGCFKLPPDISERLSNITTLRQVYKS